jgi:anaerobic ribonucleoside-triphosphate reductase activating protein
MTVNVFGIAYPVHCLGPGSRLVIWVSGCPRQCEGCASLALQNPKSGRKLPIEHLLRRILAIRLPLDGITLTGGEPVDQANAISGLLDRLFTERPEWNTLLFTGYTLDEILGRDESARRLLRLTDILVDGPFRQKVPAAHPLAGSGNQRVHYLSQRGRKLMAEVEGTPAGAFELGIGSGFTHMLIGIGKPAKRAALIQALSKQDSERRSGLS